MDKIYEAILELNTAMLMQNMNSRYSITLTCKDFERLATHMKHKFSNNFYPEYERPIADMKSFKLAGPGGYITFIREEKK